jgi:hypothetical protein
MLILQGATIPDISGYFTFGIWFPSSPIAAKPWLVNPSKAWCGVGADGGMKANFDTVEMRIKSFRFTPFNNYSGQQRNLGETYPLVVTTKHNNINMNFFKNKLNSIILIAILTTFLAPIKGLVIMMIFLSFQILFLVSIHQLN